MRLLEGLRLSPRRAFTGRVRGERLTRRTGVSIDFADYREYTEGDDLRHLDWNVLARLDSPVLKTYRDEEDLALHLLVDASASMDFASPTKFELAQRLAAALGLIGLAAGDAVFPRALGPKQAEPAPYRGRSAYPRLASWLRTLQPTEAPQTLAVSLRQFANAQVRTGVVVIFSDGMDPEVANGIRTLGARGHEIWFIQILSNLEVDPDLEGDLRLLDADGGASVDITANGATLKEYRRRFELHCLSIQEAVLRVGGRYGRAMADERLDVTIRDLWRRDRWVQ